MCFTGLFYNLYETVAEIRRVYEYLWDKKQYYNTIF